MASRGAYENSEVAARVTANLVGLRERAGFSQADLETRADLDEGALARLEEGLDELSYEVQTRLAGGLGIDAREFFEGIKWTPPAAGGRGFEVEDL